MNVAERVHTFGADEALVGIVSLPPGDRGESRADRPVVVLLNAGLVHRVGPFGLSVALARHLAAAGFRVLRFDQSGLGDSPAQPGSLSLAERCVLETRAALDFLTAEYGADRFVVAGICTGAMGSHRVGAADPRVAGVCLLDGYAYPTRSYYRARLLRRLKQPGTWTKMIGRFASAAQHRIRARLAKAGTATEGDLDQDPRAGIFYKAWPAASLVRGELEQMLGRGARVLFVYTGGWSKFVGVRQFDEMFPKLEARLRERITVRYHEHADHTYLALDDRKALFDDIRDFISRIP